MHVNIHVDVGVTLHVQTELVESFQPDTTFKATSPAQHDPPKRDGKAVIVKRASIIGKKN